VADLHQTENYARYMESLGWIVERSPGCNIFIKKIFFTAIAKIQRPSKLDLSLLKKYHPFLTKLEPLTNFKSKISNFKFDRWPLIPSKTLVLDLNKTPLSKDIRYEIRKATSNNLAIQQCGNPETFYKMLEETMRIGGWSLPLKKFVVNLWQSFQPNNSIILMTPVSGCLLVWDKDTAHYMYAACTRQGRKIGAAYLTLWEAIKFCQKKKLKFLDLEGIFDERYPDATKNWQGFTAFKRQWGGKVVEYPGSFSKYF